MRMRILSLFLNEKLKSLNEKFNKKLAPNVPNLMPGARYFHCCVYLHDHSSKQPFIQQTTVILIVKL